MVYQLFVYNKKELTTWHMGIDWACESTSGGRGTGQKGGGVEIERLREVFCAKKVKRPNSIFFCKRLIN